MINKFYSWVTAAASVCYVIAMLVFYAMKFHSGFELGQKDLYRLFLLVVICIAGYKAASSLIDGYNLGKGGQRAPADFKSALSPASIEALRNDPDPLRTVFKKRSWLFIVIFAFAFSLPVLFQLSAASAAGRRFNTEDWWFVIGGEIFIAVCLVVAWHRAKRLLKPR